MDTRLGRFVEEVGGHIIIGVLYILWIITSWWDIVRKFLSTRVFPVGTRSVLWGAHCWFIHPWFVAAAWNRLYGFPRDYRLWLAFFLHDLGYWGKQAMDSEEGERHVEWAGQIMGKWFGGHWGSFCLLHSRYYAKKYHLPISRLCVADKISVTLEPRWFYLLRVILSGEVWEYLDYASGRVESTHGDKGNSYAQQSQTMKGWHAAMVTYLQKWAKLQPNDHNWFFMEVPYVQD